MINKYNKKTKIIINYLKEFAESFSPSRTETRLDLRWKTYVSFKCKVSGEGLSTVNCRNGDSRT